MTATLYQLTATAAQMCLPVPTPAAAPDGWLDLIDHWQTLIGATAGGLLGVAGAWIVAVSARRRERRIAAGMILADLQQLVAAGESLARLADKVQSDNPQQQAESRATLVVEQLAHRRPNLFALHTPAIGQLSDIDARLYSHLFQCEIIHRAFVEGMEMRRTQPEQVADWTYGRFEVSRRSDAQRYADWLLCVEHATLAYYYLDRLVFSRWPRFIQRMRMKLRPNGFDKRSAALLTTGTLSAAASNDAASPAGTD
ncbi:hypothetical protein WK39_27335 [Burkholderia cepacia]|uniref:hypothetical protein n=1 Tax=Burkholderia cepacia TaxID=292 RepID=UPI000755A236|nr:hypothetical protein [Burkholderia cepacia]KVS51661.1 hypothetical protein WK39_27335 [Burkholderia cepacia]KVS69905.1 hypothetical protein WK40_04720 [Burkholderia cepacia]